MTATQTKRRAILIFTLNRSGVLNKIAMLIRRKMRNVDTITACATQQPGISRMTITLREDSDDKTLQVTKQIEKLTEVISARELNIDHMNDRAGDGGNFNGWTFFGGLRFFF